MIKNTQQTYQGRSQPDPAGGGANWGHSRCEGEGGGANEYFVEYYCPNEYYCPLSSKQP